ncbi:MAG: hypothetical protein LBK01_04495 [Burkholderiaceae bacterium]|jgi:hypothetical protein|nr:hypothetical protein [Burkholderiaceae bacterium]
MFSYQLLDEHAGLLLIGDYSTLWLLRDILFDVEKRAPFLQDKDSFLALAYDARKAYEGKREILSAPEHSPELGIRYGVEILWPVLIVQARMLRVSLGYVDHSKRHQAITYALEAVIEDGLKADFGQNAPEIIEAWQRLDQQDASILDMLDGMAEEFNTWNAQQREKRLVKLLLPPWLRDDNE